ncbi:hypothetical protein rsdtw13_05750 [Clostridium sp. TW13]|uniref:Uncharacterized protein n=1 Tax=Inconstantimicrobium mannanitabidum TaxID=1604901 RepID=A0ACB5R824_9CLOT|nr:hypothetical protein rsdtw13_05750 [Clostridium sp. TW13]
MATGKPTLAIKFARSLPFILSSPPFIIYICNSQSNCIEIECIHIKMRNTTELWIIHKNYISIFLVIKKKINLVI